MKRDKKYTFRLLVGISGVLALVGIFGRYLKPRPANIGKTLPHSESDATVSELSPSKESKTASAQSNPNMDSSKNPTISEAPDSPAGHGVPNGDAIERRQGMEEGFPGNFERAVADGKTSLAMDLLKGHLVHGSQSSQEVYGLLLEPMGQNAFLWQDRSLVMSFYGACVDLGCDLRDWWDRAQALAPQMSRSLKGCLEAWGIILPFLVGHRNGAIENRAEMLDYLTHCVQNNPVNDDSVQTILQVWLSLERKLGHGDQAEEDYRRIKSKVPALP